MSQKAPVRLVHYLNQFFGGIGGEEKADLPIEFREQAVGPAIGLQQAMAEKGKVIATIIGGDNYFNNNLEEARSQIRSLLKRFKPDVVVAGPAFNAGRYGLACCEVCRASKECSAPSTTAMFPGNPAVDLFRREVFILPTEDSALGMKDALQLLASFALRLTSGEPLGPPELEGYLPRGIRINTPTQASGAARAVDMILAKLSGKPFQTEVALQQSEVASPAPPVADLSRAILALVSTGGIVPRGNPDQLKHINESRWQRYSLTNSDTLAKTSWEPIHGGYDASFARKNPNVVVPVDVLRNLEKEGRIGRIYSDYYAVVGVGTSVSTCEQIGTEIAEDLLKNGVSGVILTST